MSWKVIVAVCDADELQGCLHPLVPDMRNSFVQQQWKFHVLICREYGHQVVELEDILDVVAPIGERERDRVEMSTFPMRSWPPLGRSMPAMRFRSVKFYRCPKDP